MVACRDVVRRALSRLAVVSGAEAVLAEDMALGVAAIQELIDGFRLASFGRVQTVISGLDLTAEPMTRVIGDNVSGIAVSLPTRASDGSALRDGDFVEIRDFGSGVPAQYRWSSDNARWVALSGLTESSDFPLGSKSEHGFSAVLAMRLSDDFQIEVTRQTARDASAWRAVFMAGYDGEKTPVASFY